MVYRPDYSDGLDNQEMGELVKSFKHLVDTILADGVVTDTEVKNFMLAAEVPKEFTDKVSGYLRGLTNIGQEKGQTQTKYGDVKNVDLNEVLGGLKEMIRDAGGANSLGKLPQISKAIRSR